MRRRTTRTSQRTPLRLFATRAANQTAQARAALRGSVAQPIRKFPCAGANSLSDGPDASLLAWQCAAASDPQGADAAGENLNQPRCASTNHSHLSVPREI